MTYDGVIEKPELDELYHYGVQGMKWGVRKSASRDGSSGSTFKKKKKDRYERAAEATAKDAKNLREHGYIKEAEAVQKVSDKYRAKSKTAGGKVPHKKYSTLKPSKRKPVKTLGDKGLNRKNEEYFDKLSTNVLKTMLKSMDADSNNKTKQIIDRIIEERKKPKENK